MNTVRQTRAACPKSGRLTYALGFNKVRTVQCPENPKGSCHTTASVPPSNANHTENQIFYYDERFMQRRMDYAPDVTDNAPIAHDPKTFDGFVFPTRRLVHLHDAEGRADQGFAGITLNIYSVSVE